MSLPKTFVCVFCDKLFTRRSWYDKHSCAKKKRFDTSNNLTTIKAQQLFGYWQTRMGIKKNTKLTPMAAFLSSPFYKTFNKLVEFTQTTYVISAHKYLEWLIENQIPERRWTNPKNLDVFRDTVRAQEEVVDQIDRSFRNIRAHCTENGIPLTEFFSRIGPVEALFMIRQNRLMPWVLFGYDRAIRELINRFSQEHLLALDEFVNLEYWLTKTEEHPDKRALAQRLSEEQIGRTS